jgi:hypothetical protein
VVVLDRNEIEEAHQLLRAPRLVRGAEGRSRETVEDAARRFERWANAARSPPTPAWDSRPKAPRARPKEPPPRCRPYSPARISK